MMPSARFLVNVGIRSEPMIQEQMETSPLIDIGSGPSGNVN